MVLILFGLVFAQHAAALVKGGVSQRADWVPIVYFTLQSLAGALSVWYTALYNIALAMHYVESHVVMMPRVFGPPVESTSRADRLRRAISPTKAVFYAGLLALAWGIWFAQRTQLYLDPQASVLPVRLVVHALDGIFLTHFFIEAFVWKFSKPHYRETLGPRYFAPARR